MIKGISVCVVLLSSVFVLTLGKFSFAESKTVLIVYSYSEGLIWTRQCDEGIRRALPENVHVERLYMDTKRIPQEEFESRAQGVLDAFRRMQPDLVMLGDDNALRLIGPEVAASHIPVVYLGINGNPRDYFTSLPDNVIGVIERMPLLPWARLLFDIVPSADSMLVLMDDSPTADAIIRSSFYGKRFLSLNGKDIVSEKVKNWSSWRRLIVESKYDIILMPVYHSLVDADRGHIAFDDVVAWTSENSRVPVFASQDYAVGDHGVVGALSVDGEKHGRIAGLMAKGLLEGRPAAELAVADDQQGVFYFNIRQLQRFGLVLPEELKRKANYKK